MTITLYYIEISPRCGVCIKIGQPTEPGGHTAGTKAQGIIVCRVATL